MNAAPYAGAVWEGIHVRSSYVVGARLGAEVARYDLERLHAIVGVKTRNLTASGCPGAG